MYSQYNTAQYCTVLHQIPNISFSMAWAIESKRAINQCSASLSCYWSHCREPVSDPGQVSLTTWTGTVTHALRPRVVCSPIEKGLILGADTLPSWACGSALALELSSAHDEAFVSRYCCQQIVCPCRHRRLPGVEQRHASRIDEHSFNLRREETASRGSIHALLNELDYEVGVRVCCFEEGADRPRRTATSGHCSHIPPDCPKHFEIPSIGRLQG